MKSIEVERSNGHTTSLREKVVNTLETLALLKSQLEQFGDGEQIAASLDNIRAKALKTDPTLIWERSITTVEISEETAARLDEQNFNGQTGGTGELQESQTKTQTLKPVILACPESDFQQATVSDSGIIAAPDVVSPQSDEGDVLEQISEERLTEDKLLETESREKELEEAQLSFYADKPEVMPSAREEEIDVYEDVGAKDLDVLGIHLREIRQIPIQRENHERWGQEIFAGRIALKALSILSESQELLPYQKEKVADALRKGKFLLERLDLRIISVNKRLKEDKYKNEQDREYDREFIETVLANEYLASVVLAESLVGVEDEEEKSLTIDQFIDKRTDFANQGLESWNNLVMGNLRLVVSIARRYQNHGIDLSDLIGYGQEGLMIVAAEYDARRITEEGKPIEFSTYATWWIKQKITRALADYGSMIRLPAHVHQELQKRLREQGQDLQADISDLDSIPKTLADALSTRTVFSLDEPIKADEEEATLKDFILDNPEQDVQEIAEKGSLKDTVREVLATLTDKQRRVIELRFGLIDDRKWTLEEIGQEFGVTREAVRQTEANALRNLRHPSRARKLHSLLKDE